MDVTSLDINKTEVELETAQSRRFYNRIDQEVACPRISQSSLKWSSGAGLFTNDIIRRMTKTSQPLGRDDFTNLLEEITEKKLRRLKPSLQPGSIYNKRKS
jgi:hypothetical protein